MAGVTAIDTSGAVVTMTTNPVNAQNRRFREEIIAIFDTLSDREPRNNNLKRALTWNPGSLLKGARHITLGGQYVVIATGTTPARPAGVQFDEERVIDSDGILNLRSIPSSMVVVGAGVIGAEYASIFAALGTKVTVVEKRDTMLDFCDQEIIDVTASTAVLFARAVCDAPVG